MLFINLVFTLIQLLIAIDNEILSIRCRYFSDSVVIQISRDVTAPFRAQGSNATGNRVILKWRTTLRCWRSTPRFASYPCHWPFTSHPLYLSLVPCHINKYCSMIDRCMVHSPVSLAGVTSTLFSMTSLAQPYRVSCLHNPPTMLGTNEFMGIWGFADWVCVCACVRVWILGMYAVSGSPPGCDYRIFFLPLFIYAVKFFYIYFLSWTQCNLSSWHNSDEKDLEGADPVSTIYTAV